MNNNEYLEPLPDNKVEVVKVEYASSDWAVNQIIQNEYQVGWIVQQIIYLEHVQSVMILFKRKD